MMAGQNKSKPGGKNSSTKRSREDISISDEVESLSDLWTNMKMLLSDNSSRLETKIDACKASIDTLENEFVALRKECEDKMGYLHSTIENVRFEQLQTAEDVGKLERAVELIVSGVPYQANENLAQLFANISTVLGYQSGQLPIVDLQRLSKLPIAAGSTPPILIQFALRNVRNEFYRRYMGSRSLTLRHLGFDAENRVFINENLTKLSRVIRAEALKLKKSGSVVQVYTRNGAVFVKRRGATEAEQVRSIDQLLPAEK